MYTRLSLISYRISDDIHYVVTMLELNKIHCGDNCDLLGQLPRECIDLVVTSPPYDDLRTYCGHSWDFFGVTWQLKRVLKPGGVIVWVVGDATKDGSETGTSLEQALHFKRLGLNLHDTMIYEKGVVAFPESTRYNQKFEFMFVFSRGAPKTFNGIKDHNNISCGRKVSGKDRDDNGFKEKSGKNKIISEFSLRGNVWHIWNQERGIGHPAPFPLKLASDHIASWSNPGDLVLDPFCGSGTTVKAAKELGRRFLGIEINPEYCSIAERRIAQQVLEFDQTLLSKFCMHFHNAGRRNPHGGMEKYNAWCCQKGSPAYEAIGWCKTHGAKRIVET